MRSVLWQNKVGILHADMLQGDRPDCSVLPWSKIPINGERAVGEEMDDIGEVVEAPSDDENPNSAKVIRDNTQQCS